MDFVCQNRTAAKWSTVPLTLYVYKNILSPKICEKMSSFFVLFQYFHLLKYARKYRFLEKKIHIFEGVCGGIKKQSQKKSKHYIRVLIVSSNVRPEPTRHDTTRPDPVTRSKTTRLNNFFMRKISHCKKKKLPFYDIMTLVFGQSLYRSMRLEITSFFFLQVLLKLMPVTNMI